MIVKYSQTSGLIVDINTGSFSAQSNPTNRKWPRRLGGYSEDKENKR